MALPLPPVAVPEHWSGQDALDNLVRLPGLDARWMFAALGALAALDDPAMHEALAWRLRHTPAAHVTGVVAWAAAGVTDARRVQPEVRDWLLAHQGDLSRFMDQIGDVARPARPYGPVTVDHAATLLAEALTVPAANTLHNDMVAMVRSVDPEVNPVRLTHNDSRGHVLGDVLFLGRAAWESDSPVGDVAGEWSAGRGEHHLALYLRARGVAEAAVTELEPRGIGSGPLDAPGAGLMVEHAASVLAAGGVERVVGKVGYGSPWRRQRGWDWDRGERVNNMACLRRAVLDGAGWWLGYGRDPAPLEAFLADLHEAVRADREVVAIRGGELFETPGRGAPADVLWFPLLDYSPDVLGFFGPPGDGDQRLGDWVLSCGELTIHGVQPLPTPLSSPSLAALAERTDRRRREGPDASVGL